MSFVQDYNKELYHHGVKGMKWGHRKARNTSSAIGNRYRSKAAESQRKADSKQPMSTKKKVAIAAGVGAAVAATALAVYGGKKMSTYIKSEAGRRSYETGKKYAQEHFFSNGDYEYGRRALANTDKRTRRVSNSTVEAVKYLRHPERYIVDPSITRWQGTRY